MRINHAFSKRALRGINSCGLRAASFHQKPARFLGDVYALAFSNALILLGSQQHGQNLFIEAMEELDLHGHDSCPVNRHSGVSAVRDVYRQQQKNQLLEH